MASKIGGWIALCSIYSHGMRSLKPSLDNKPTTGLQELQRETTKLTKTEFSEESHLLILTTLNTGAQKKMELTATAMWVMDITATAHPKVTSAPALQTTGIKKVK